MTNRLSRSQIAVERMPTPWSSATSVAMHRWVESVLAGTEGVLPEQIPCGAHQRLVAVLTDRSAGKADRAMAIRGWLRAESLRWGVGEEPFRLKWLGADESSLKSYGLIRRDGHWLALAWRPNWLADVPSVGVDTAWWPSARRPSETVPGDPMLGLLGLEHYTSNAQRDAARAVLCAPSGTCLAICLPTGAGKSLCAFLPALLPQERETERLGVSVVVVPVVALQLDLEDRLSQTVQHRVAYRPEEVDAAAEIRARCRVGTQGPLIVSPEALNGELLDTLCTAARQGYLRYFVVDEAHVVLSWGDDFRPAFLQLAGVREELLSAAASDRQSPFVTLLLSATFSDYHLRWLRSLFGPADRFHVIHAARLRPEPAYWSTVAADDIERENRIMEALRHIPRPSIIYTTRKSTCKQWYAKLKGEGFLRVATMTGETDGDERRQMLKRWKSDQIDVVVATSAFGLGVDKGDVRSIVHAELPESVDRFYQDVGRSGRDGHESLSLLITVPKDLRRARKIGQPKFISPEYGWQRWTQMHTRRVGTDEPGVFLVPLKAGRDLDMRGDYNRGWNLRTLQLLARVGAVKFVPHPERGWNQVAVRLGLAPSLDISFWYGPVEELRQELLRDNRLAGKLLQRLLDNSTECRSELFEACYSSPTFGLPVVRACGGCPACRAARAPLSCGRMLPRRSPVEPPPPAVRTDHHGRASACQKWLGPAATGLILLPEQSISPEEMEQFFLWAMQAEWSVFVVPEHVRSIVRKTAVRWRETAFLADRPPYEYDVVARQPTCWWLDESVPDWWGDATRRGLDQPVQRLLVARQDTPHYCAEHRRLFDLFAGPRLLWDEWRDRFLA